MGRLLRSLQNNCVRKQFDNSSVDRKKFNWNQTKVNQRVLTINLDTVLPVVPRDFIYSFSRWNIRFICSISKTVMDGRKMVFSSLMGRVPRVRNPSFIRNRFDIHWQWTIICVHEKVPFLYNNNLSQKLSRTLSSGEIK